MKVFLIVSTLLLSSSFAFAQIKEYTDEKGVIHLGNELRPRSEWEKPPDPGKPYEQPDAPKSSGRSSRTTRSKGNRVLETIKNKCSREWGSDFRMRAYCEKQQLESISTLMRRRKANPSNETYTTIRRNCLKQWPKDYRMMGYCEKQQIEALDKLLK